MRIVILRFSCSFHFIKMIRVNEGELRLILFPKVLFPYRLTLMNVCENKADVKFPDLQWLTVCCPLKLPKYHVYYTTLNKSLYNSQYKIQI